MGPGFTRKWGSGGGPNLEEVVELSVGPGHQIVVVVDVVAAGGGEVDVPDLVDGQSRGLPGLDSMVLTELADHLLPG